MSKGSTKAAINQVGTDNAYASGYNQQAGQVNNELFPFLTGEVTNPTGFGDDTVSKMKTQAGQIGAAGVGKATEAATLLGSRTGNTAATPGIIDASARNAMKTEADTATGIDISNAKAKLAQQQEGAAGLGNLENLDTNSALRALGLTDESINAWTGARSQTFPSEFSAAYAKALASNLSQPSAAGAAGGGG